MTGSAGSIRQLEDAIELAEMLEGVADAYRNRAGELPLGGMRLSLHQLANQLRTLRIELEPKAQTLESDSEQSARAVRGVPLSSRIRRAPTMTGRVRDIPLAGAERSLDAPSHL